MGGWDGQRGGAHREAGRRGGVRGWIGEASRKQSWSGGSWPWTGLGRRGDGCPRRVGFWGGASKMGTKEGFSRRGEGRGGRVLGAGEERERKAAREQSEREGFGRLLSPLSPLRCV
jgi:hypothetical protein